MSTTTNRTRGHPCLDHRTAQAARPSRVARRRAIAAGVCVARLSGALLFGCGFGVGAAEAQDSRVDLFGGAGVLVLDHSRRPTADLGANVWISRHWGGSIRQTIGKREYGTALVTNLGIRYRVALYDGRTELHFGASPVAFSVYKGRFDADVAAMVDVFAGRRLSRRFGVGFGLSTFIGDGAFFHPMGLAFWSFD